VRFDGVTVGRQELQARALLVAKEAVPADEERDACLVLLEQGPELDPRIDEGIVE